MDFKYFTYTEFPMYKNALEFLALQSGVDYQIIFREGGWMFNVNPALHAHFTKIHDKYIVVDGVNFSLK